MPSMMERGYRTLCPAPRRAPGESPTASDQHHDEDEDPDRKKHRSRHFIACNNCRLKKRACDGGKPTCSPCVKRKLECVYREERATIAQTTELHRQFGELEQRFNDQTDLVHRLIGLPEPQAVNVLRRLKSVSDPLAALSSILDSVGTQEPRRPEHHARDAGASSSTASPSGFRYNHTADPRSDKYPNAEPHGAAALDSFTEPTTPDRKPSVAAMTESSDKWGSSGSSLPPPEGQGLNSGGFLKMPSPSSETSDSLLKPAYLPQPNMETSNLGWDERLSRLQIGFWTMVPISNQLAAVIISRYLQAEQAIIGVLDAELFLSDLVDRSPRFCSAFLVSSVLYHAAQAYTIIDVQTGHMVPAFFREADARWQGERLADSYANVAALQLFSLACHLQGLVSKSKDVLSAGRDMATRLTGARSTPALAPIDPRLQMSP
ncbi:hypothetical protein BX600DRAFT_300680 [Xylariales sp. PMI_506]|nr:hypothetical protein BX600DRAFT_300680 [Xylariales sp. PMI_506]